MRHKTILGLAGTILLLQLSAFQLIQIRQDDDVIRVSSGGSDAAQCALRSGVPAAFSPGTPQPDGTCLLPYETTPEGVKVFRLRPAPVSWEVAPGDVKPAFAYNGTIPGPTIRVNEGDRIRVVVQNDLGEPTVVHWHGMVLPNAQDGVPGFTQDTIPNGAQYTYEYTAVTAGTHWYHPHIDGDQPGKGLYGSLEVVPRTQDRLVHRDYRLFVGDTNLGLVFNGKSFPATAPFPAKVGELIRIRITSTGEMSHPIHLHGQPFQLVAQDGFDLPTPQTMDTLLVSTAQTFDIVTRIVAPGKWLFHCHIWSHMHRPGGGSGKHDGHGNHDMSGLVTFVDAADGAVPAPDPAGPPPEQIPPAPALPDPTAPPS